jgi:transposase
VFATIHIYFRVDFSIITVQRVVKRYEETGSVARLPGTGAARATMPKEAGYLHHIVFQNKKTPNAKITDAWNQYIDKNVHLSTTRRCLHQQRIYSRVALRKPAVSPVNRERRVT